MVKQYNLQLPTFTKQPELSVNINQPTMKGEKTIANLKQERSAGSDWLTDYVENIYFNKKD